VSNRKLGALFLCIFIAICSCAMLGQDSSRPFIVVQALSPSYKGVGGLDLSSFGVKEVPIICESCILPSRDNDRLFDTSKLDAMMAKIQKGPIPTVIDIERWPIYPAEKADRAESVHKLLAVLQALRRARPDMLFGFYGVAPVRVYWPLVASPDPRPAAVRPAAVQKQRAEKREWELSNQQAKTDLVPQVDAIYPSLYTFYQDETRWEEYATVTLQAARQFNKPVYCFLMPRYQRSGQPYAGQSIEPRFWRLQLDTCYRYADGIVLYDEVAKGTPWDPDAPWWRETVSFLRTINK
jgi:hypothetical protein